MDRLLRGRGRLERRRRLARHLLRRCDFHADAQHFFQSPSVSSMLKRCSSLRISTWQRLPDPSRSSARNARRAITRFVTRRTRSASSTWGTLQRVLRSVTWRCRARKAMRPGSRYLKRGFSPRTTAGGATAAMCRGCRGVRRSRRSLRRGSRAASAGVEVAARPVNTAAPEEPWRRGRGTPTEAERNDSSVSAVHLTGNK